MALDIPSLVHSVIAIADSLSKSTQPEILHRMTIGRNVEGPIIQSEEDAVPRRGIVEDMGEEVLGATGNDALVTSKITFFEAVPVDMSDLFIMPDGSTANVVRRGGMLDGDGVPYFREVFVGRAGR
jgi:hypothetical protein